MLISEFARRAGLTSDTVRFYVRLGLLRPETSRKGGTNPYQIFTEEHVETAGIIRMAQSLGFSLKEIAAINEEHLAGALTPQRSAELMRGQLAQLEQKSSSLEAMIGYLKAKLAWLEEGMKGSEPRFSDYAGTNVPGPENVCVALKLRESPPRRPPARRDFDQIKRS